MKFIQLMLIMKMMRMMKIIILGGFFGFVLFAEESKVESKVESEIEPEINSEIEPKVESEESEVDAKVEDEDLEARRELVLRHLQEKNVEGAIASLREGMAKGFLKGEMVFIELYLQIISQAPERLKSLIDELTPLIDRVESTEQSTEHQMILADALVLIGRHESAIELLQSVLKNAPSTPFARERLVDLYLRKGLTEKAIAELNILIEENPKNPSAHYLLASIAAERDEYELAASHYEEAIEIQPQLQMPYYDLVRLHLGARRPMEALRTLARARILFPKRFLGEFYTGIALGTLRRSREALSHLIEAESLANEHSPERLTPFFYFQLGAMHERNGNYEKAEEKFLKGLDAHPEDAETLNYLGYMWAEQGKRLGEASEWIKKALDIDPENAAIADSMGWVLFQQGHPDRALPFLLRAKAGLDVPDPVILDHLGDVYEALGEAEKARTFWEASLEIEFNEMILKKLQSSNSSNSNSRSSESSSSSNSSNSNSSSSQLSSRSFSQ